MDTCVTQTRNARVPSFFKGAARSSNPGFGLPATRWTSAIDRAYRREAAAGIHLVRTSSQRAEHRDRLGAAPWNRFRIGQLTDVRTDLVAAICPEIMRRPQQLEFPTRGGRRPGAGRPRGSRVSHAPRERFAKPLPVHVTLRMREHVWNLRSGRSFRRIRRCFENARGRFGARLIEFSVQGNHLHLILEADSKAALSRAMKGLCIRLAKALNAMMDRAGAVFFDHYHSRVLRTPAELVNAIAYVLQNAAHHFGNHAVDEYSSLRNRDVLAAATGWLLRKGWRR